MHLNTIREMTKNHKIHLLICSLINLILILIIITSIREGNDKEVVFLVLSYPILIIVNAFIWLILRIFKRPEYKIYKYPTIGLFIFLIPTIIASFI